MAVAEASVKYLIFSQISLRRTRNYAW